MSTSLILLFASAATGFTITPTPPRLSPARLQTLIPDAPTITKPDALPETWSVPDTFTFPSKQTQEPPFFRLTLFKSSKFETDYIASALVKTIGIATARANEIAQQAQSLGFAVVGEYVQEVAEMYAASLKEKDLVIDVSAAC